MSAPTPVKLRLVKHVNSHVRGASQHYHVVEGPGACGAGRGPAPGTRREVWVMYDPVREEPFRTLGLMMTIYARDVCAECRGKLMAAYGGGESLREAG